VTVVATLSGVVLEQVSEHGRLGQVIDGYDLVTLSAEHLTECQTTNAAEAIDSNFYRHGKNPPFLYCLFLKTYLAEVKTLCTNYIFYRIFQNHARVFGKI
jgi:hypothetical protein